MTGKIRKAIAVPRTAFWSDVTMGNVTVIVASVLSSFVSIDSAEIQGLRFGEDYIYGPKLDGELNLQLVPLGMGQGLRSDPHRAAFCLWFRGRRSAQTRIVPETTTRWPNWNLCRHMVENGHE